MNDVSKAITLLIAGAIALPCLLLAASAVLRRRLRRARILYWEKLLDDLKRELDEREDHGAEHDPIRLQKSDPWWWGRGR